MNSSKYITKQPGDDTTVPYKNLYIYYLKGRLRSDRTIADNNFIGNWQEDESSFLFYSKPSREKVEKIIRAESSLSLLDEFQMSYDQWHGSQIEPFQIGRFFISPPWQTPYNKMDTYPENLHIILDPGVVFGTGTHTTTKNCLEALELAFRREKIESVLDIGTGTGLLALAASMLGCKHTIAIDLNFLAASTALTNVRLNRQEKKICVVQGRAEDFIDSPFDLMIANIHYDVMKHLIISNGFLSKKWFILSGLLRSQAKNLLFRLSQQPVRIVKKWESDGIWHTFLGVTC